MNLQSYFKPNVVWICYGMLNNVCFARGRY